MGQAAGEPAPLQLPPLAGEKVLDVELENYTPLMAGGWDGRVTVALEGGRVLPQAVSLSKQLVGRARWFLRSLVSTAHGAASHGEAERWPPYKLLLHRDGMVELGLVQLLFGSTQPTWRALYAVSLTPVDPEGCEIDSTFTMRVYWHGQGKVRALLANRYALIIMDSDGAGSGFSQKAPLAPGCRFRLVVTRRLSLNGLAMHVKDVPGNAPHPRSFDDLVSAVLLATLRLVGLGQGTARGFGRFRVASSGARAEAVLIPDGSAARDILDLMRRLDATSKPREAENIIRSMLAILLRAVGGSMPRLGALAIRLSDVEVYDPARRRLGELSDTYRRLPNMKLKRGSETIIGDLRIYGGARLALEIIGLVVLKAAWKSVNREQRRGGGHYHTWILGLPRRQKISNPVTCKGNPVNVDLPTGYLLPAREREATVRLKVRQVGGAERDGPDTADVYVAYAPDGEHIVGFKDGRRQSPIHLMPVNADTAMIAVIPYMASDFRDLIGGLYHAGGFIDRQTSRKIPRFLAAVRLARVEAIARRGVPRLCECYGRFVNDCVRGVAEPGARMGKCPRCGESNPANGGLPSLLEDADIVEEAYRAALEFIRELLG